MQRPFFSQKNLHPHQPMNLWPPFPIKILWILLRTSLHLKNTRKVFLSFFWVKMNQICTGHTPFWLFFFWKKKFKKGIILTGGRENVIFAFSPSTPQSPLFFLTGHSDNICSISAFGNPENPTIVSGSWDTLAKVWQNGQCVQTLRGHSLAVWSVLPLDDLIITGFAPLVWKKRIKGSFFPNVIPISYHQDLLTRPSRSGKMEAVSRP